MKIIALTQNNSSPYPCITSVNQELFQQIANQQIDFDYDFAIDLRNGSLLKDPETFLDKDENVSAYYGDFLDKNGHYIFQTSFPSVRNIYPGIIISKEYVGMKLEDFCKKSIVRYVPELIFRSFT